MASSYSGSTLSEFSSLCNLARFQCAGAITVSGALLVLVGFCCFDNFRGLATEEINAAGFFDDACQFIVQEPVSFCSL